MKGLLFFQLNNTDNKPYNILLIIKISSGIMLWSVGRGYERDRTRDLHILDPVH